LVEREFNLSYSSSLPSKNRIIAGSWFTTGEPNQVSMEAGIMKSLHTKLGDELTFDIAGQIYQVQITSIRKLDWNSMRVNFFAMMPMELLKEAPQSWIMAFRQDEAQRIDMDIVDRFPNITAIDIQDSLTQAQDILSQLIFAIELLFIFTLLAGLLVLMIALVTVQEQRMKEVAVLKTLGADHTFLMRVWLLELILSGSIAGFLSGGFASFVGWYLATYLLEIEMGITWWVFGLGFLMGIALNSLASLWLRSKTFKASPLMILQT
jgi:putative ABC transport system permease protein